MTDGGVGYREFQALRDDMRQVRGEFNNRLGEIRSDLREIIGGTATRVEKVEQRVYELERQSNSGKGVDSYRRWVWPILITVLVNAIGWLMVLLSHPHA